MDTENAVGTSDGQVEGAQAPPADGARSAVVAGLAITIVAIVAQLVVVGEVIVPLVIFSSLFTLLVIGLRLTQSKILAWVTVLALIAYLAGGLPFTISDLSNPDSPNTFIPTLVFTLGTVVTIPLAVLLGIGRGHGVRTGRVWGAVGVIMLIGAVGSVVARIGVEDDVALAGDVTIEAVDVEYPESVALPSGGTGLLVVNADPFHHTFVVTGTDIAVSLPASTSVRVPIDLAPGAYAYLCDVPGHERMEGTLTVE